MVAPWLRLLGCVAAARTRRRAVRAGIAAGERESHVESASFTGHVVSDDGSTATVDVDSLVTHQAGGCTMWSGSYEFSMQQGQWLIAKAAISPGSCS
jgi:hypothetical protein